MDCIRAELSSKNAYREILQNVIEKARHLFSNKDGIGRGTNDSDTFTMSNLTAALITMTQPFPAAVSIWVEMSQPHFPKRLSSVLLGDYT